jgi:phosphatidylglycerol:prolipoprotein diacylglycerol transferase
MPAVIVIDLDPNLFQVGPLLITWHGVFSVLGILAAARLGQYLARQDGIEPDRIYDAAFWMVVAGIVGARVLYVWENYRQFTGNLLKALAINEGGISQWGGLFGAMVGAYLWSLRSRLGFWKIIDAGGAGALIGLAIGRIGDVINGEHHAIGSNLPWAVEYVNDRTLGEHGRPVHPEVAYELLWCLLLLGALLPFHRRLKAILPDGVLGLGYLSLYAAGRFLLSFLRTDSLAFGLRQAQWASLAMIVVAAVAVPILYRRRARRSVAAAA